MPLKNDRILNQSRNNTCTSVPVSDDVRRPDRVAARCVMKWQRRTKMTMRRRIIIRASLCSGAVYVLRRSRTEAFGSGGRYAMAKSLAEEGDEGVTMTAGKGDFSVLIGSMS